MPRHIPYSLLQHLKGDATTTCLIVKFDPATPGFDSYGVADLDRNVVYDDGDGELTFWRKIGAQPTTMVSSSGLAVDHSEVSGLLPEFDVPISEADIVAGVYDFAEFTAYLVNYEDLSMGHIVLAHGTTGQNTVTEAGLAFLEELRGLAQDLKVSLCEKWSLGCRATYGSQPGGPDRFPCMKDVSSEWQAGTVATVGLETTRTFTTSGLASLYTDAVPSAIRWTTGRNAGRGYEVEGFADVSGVITIDLAFTTMFPIAEDDEFEWRNDCSKTEAACKERGNYQWYRGEPKIPIGDAGQIEVPGASAGVGTGASTHQDFQAE